MAKVWLTTPQGWGFWAESFVSIGGKRVSLDSLTPEQRGYVMTQNEVHALNAAAGGEGTYRAEGLPKFAEVFPELAREA